MRCLFGFHRWFLQGGKYRTCLRCLKVQVSSIDGWVTRDMVARDVMELARALDALVDLLKEIEELEKRDG